MIQICQICWVVILNFFSQINPAIFRFSLADYFHLIQLYRWLILNFHDLELTI